MPYLQATSQSIRHVEAVELTERQKEVLLLIEHHHSISTSELRDKLSFSPSIRWVRDTLGKLKRHGYVDVVGQTTARKWFIIKRGK